LSDTVDSLILDLLEWIGPDPRPYTEVLAARRTDLRKHRQPSPHFTKLSDHDVDVCS
jgi:hypothetical protein